MMPKPKKPPDPPQLQLLCSSRPYLPSYSLAPHSLNLNPARSFVLSRSFDRFSHAPFSRSGPLMACFVSTSIKRYLIVPLTAIFKRSVCFPVVSRFSSVSMVTDLNIQTQGSLHEADGAAPVNRFEIFFTLCVFQVCGLLDCTIIFLFQLIWCFRLSHCYAAALGLV